MFAPWVVTQKINEQKLGLHNDARKEALSGPHLSVHSNSSGSAAAYPTHPALCATLYSPAHKPPAVRLPRKKGLPLPSSPSLSEWSLNPWIPASTVIRSYDHSSLLSRLKVVDTGSPAVRRRFPPFQQRMRDPIKWLVGTSAC